MRDEGCKVRTNKNDATEQLMSVWVVFTVVHCGAEGEKAGRTDVGHVLAWRNLHNLCSPMMD